LIPSGKHADIFNSDQNKQIPAIQKMADFIDNEYKRFIFT